MGHTIKGVTYTEREIDIISCLCNGGTTKSIERLLGISPNAINFYIKSIKEKMNCFSRESIIRFVEDSGEYEYINKKYAKLRGLSCSVAEIDNRQKTDKWQKFFGENVILKIGCLTSAFGVIITSIISFYLEELPLSYEIELPNKNILIQRENIMNQIKKGFDSNEEIKFVVLVGESGIGKTTIARKYIKEHDFSLKAEIDAESEFKIVKSLEYLVFRLSKTEDQLRIMQMIRNIKDLDEKGQKLKILLAELLKKYKSWCLIYDNAEDLELLRKWLPLDGDLFDNGNIIITTKNANICDWNFSYTLHIINVPYLSDKERSDMFFRILKNKKDKLIRNRENVEKTLNRLPATPLDISTAAYFVKNNNMELENYIDLIKKERMPKMNINLGNNNTRETIVATAFDKIANESEQNWELLTMACLLDSENIDPKYFKLIAPEEVVREFIFQLKKYSFLNEFGGHFSIHRSTQEIGLAYLLSKFGSENRTEKIINSMADHRKIEWKWSKSEIKMAKEESRMLISHLESMLKKLDVHKNLGNYEQWKMNILIALYFAYNGECSYKESYERGKQLIELNSKNEAINGKSLALLLLQHIYVSIYYGETNDVVKNAENCLKICESENDAGHLKIGTMLYLSRYYFDFEPNYEKATKLLDECFKLKESISEKDWDIVMCVFANQLYRGYEACYVNNNERISEAIGNLKQALLDKGFTSYRAKRISKIPLDKTVFLMYAIEMMINISRGYNMIGEFEKALETELDIAYIYDLLGKQGVHFNSQEFQFNTIYGTTLLKLGRIEEAQDVLKKALDNTKNISSNTDLFSAYVSRAELNARFGNYESVLTDCENALKVNEMHSNYYLLEKCKCLYFRAIANYKLNRFEESKRCIQEVGILAQKLIKNLQECAVYKRAIPAFINQNFENIEDMLIECEAFINEFTKVKTMH